MQLIYLADPALLCSTGNTLFWVCDLPISAKHIEGTGICAAKGCRVIDTLVVA